MALKLVELLQDPLDQKTIPAYAWFSITLLVITIIQIKTIVNFIIDNVSVYSILVGSKCSLPLLATP